VQEWLALPGRRIKLHFIPTYCPHLNPIERLWGVMHKHVTHNKCYATCAQFADATLDFLRETVPRNWAGLCDSVTDNFRIINPKDFRVVTSGVYHDFVTLLNVARSKSRRQIWSCHSNSGAPCVHQK
jgi:hypothetical protein